MCCDWLKFSKIVSIDFIFLIKIWRYQRLQVEAHENYSPKECDFLDILNSAREKYSPLKKNWFFLPRSITMAGEEILKFPYKIKSSLKHSEKSVEKNCLLPLKKEGISWYVFHDHFRFSCGKKHRRFLGSKYFSSHNLYYCRYLGNPGALGL